MHEQPLSGPCGHSWVWEMQQWGCAGRQLSFTQWAPAFGMPISPNCVDAEGLGPLTMGAPGGACVLATTGEYVRAE